MTSEKTCRMLSIFNCVRKRDGCNNNNKAMADGSARIASSTERRNCCDETKFFDFPHIQKFQIWSLFGRARSDKDKWTLQNYFSTIVLILAMRNKSNVRKTQRHERCQASSPFSLHKRRERHFSHHPSTAYYYLSSSYHTLRIMLSTLEAPQHLIMIRRNDNHDVKQIQTTKKVSSSTSDEECQRRIKICIWLCILL